MYIDCLPYTMKHFTYVYVNYLFQELAPCLQFLVALLFLMILNSYSLVFLGVLLNSHFQTVPRLVKNVSCRSFFQGAFPCCIQKFSSEYCRTLLDSLCPTVFFSQQIISLINNLHYCQRVALDRLSTCPQVVATSGLLIFNRLPQWYHPYTFLLFFVQRSSADVPLPSAAHSTGKSLLTYPSTTGFSPLVF